MGTSVSPWKPADMGLAKKLNLSEGTSFETHLAGGAVGGGSGTAGWQAGAYTRSLLSST
jgi:hypothetical protein